MRESHLRVNHACKYCNYHLFILFSTVLFCSNENKLIVIVIVQRHAIYARHLHRLKALGYLKRLSGELKDKNVFDDFNLPLFAPNNMQIAQCITV